MSSESEALRSLVRHFGDEDAADLPEVRAMAGLIHLDGERRLFVDRYALLTKTEVAEIRGRTGIAPEKTHNNPKL